MFKESSGQSQKYVPSSSSTNQ
jgi:hypothetical protein